MGRCCTVDFVPLVTAYAWIINVLVRPDFDNTLNTTMLWPVSSFPLRQNSWPAAFIVPVIQVQVAFPHAVHLGIGIGSSNRWHAELKQITSINACTTVCEVAMRQQSKV